MIEGTRSVTAFFRECLVSALRSQRVTTSELAESYLVQLLSDLADSSKSPLKPELPTLVEMLKLVNEAQGAEKARLLREVGDAALLRSGVFREQLLHRGMSLSYFESVGGSAYRQAGYLHRVLRAAPLDELCLELGAKFLKLSNALDAAAPLGLGSNDGSLVRLLDRFRRSGRPWMRHVLLQRGLDPKEFAS